MKATYFHGRSLICNVDDVHVVDDLNFSSHKKDTTLIPRHFEKCRYPSHQNFFHDDKLGLGLEESGFSIIHFFIVQIIQN